MARCNPFLGVFFLVVALVTWENAAASIEFTTGSRVVAREVKLLLEVEVSSGAAAGSFLALRTSGAAET